MRRNNIHVIAIIQIILHSLGLIGITLGLTAIIFGNTDRGVDLVIGGVAFIVLKYVAKFIYLIITKRSSFAEETKN